MSEKKPVEIYQLKIVLNEIEPPIFRILQIKGNANLGKLHDYIQGILGWTNSHLHEFDINAKRYRSEDQLDYEGLNNPNEEVRELARELLDILKKNQELEFRLRWNDKK